MSFEVEIGIHEPGRINEGEDPFVCIGTHLRDSRVRDG